MDTGDFLQGELAVGIAVSLINIAIHAVIMGLLSWAAHRTTLVTAAAKARVQLVLVMWVTVSILMAAHLVEVGVWAASYRWLGVTPEGADAFYFAFVSYTTLGYGDILAIKHWRLLGPLAAMNGMLLFGWSVAVIYDVLRAITRTMPAATDTPE
jgi:hypothetical protein